MAVAALTTAVVVVSPTQQDSNPARSTSAAIAPIIGNGPPIPIPYSTEPRLRCGGLRTAGLYSRRGADRRGIVRAACRPFVVLGGRVADLLDEEEIEQRLDELGDWEREGDEIQKVFEFDDFPTAIEFVNDVARLAERYDHHPDIDIRWNKVRLALSTHSEGGLTSLDFDLAGDIEQSIS